MKGNPKLMCSTKKVVHICRITVLTFKLQTVLRFDSDSFTNLLRGSPVGNPHLPLVYTDGCMVCSFARIDFFYEDGDVFSKLGKPRRNAVPFVPVRSGGLNTYLSKA